MGNKKLVILAVLCSCVLILTIGAPDIFSGDPSSHSNNDGDDRSEELSVESAGSICAAGDIYGYPGVLVVVDLEGNLELEEGWPIFCRVSPPQPPVSKPRKGVGTYPAQEYDFTSNN